MIYAIDAQGRLFSYQHLDLVEGGAYWANNGTGQQIGSGWLSYQHLTASPNACPTFPAQCMSQGDGLTCGTGGDSKTLYRTYQGVTSPVRYCANGCKSMPLHAGVWQDQCSAAPGKKSVVIQAGHENTDGNCRDALVGAHGATDEAVWTAEIAHMVVAKLVTAGYDARQADANFNCDPLVLQHFDAVVSVHYQPKSTAGIKGGYFLRGVLPQFDGASNASAALGASLDFYYDQTGVPKNIIADYTNINSYYLKNDDLLSHHGFAGFTLSQDTPFVLIEAGEGAPGGAQHDVLWNQKDLVASGIAEGVIAYLQRL